MAEVKYHRNHPIPDRVALRAATNYDVDDSGCWVTGYTKNPAGYGMISGRVEGAPKSARARVYLTHRAAWVRANGAIPDGMVVDHMCFNKGCVNPEHLRLLTIGQNVSRKAKWGEDWPLDECRWGHKLTEQTTGGKKVIRGRCGACLRERNAWQTSIRKYTRRLELVYGLALTKQQQAMYDEFMPLKQARLNAAPTKEN